jgi:hypothetical protein
MTVGSSQKMFCVPLPWWTSKSTIATRSAPFGSTRESFFGSNRADLAGSLWWLDGASIATVARSANHAQERAAAESSVRRSPIHEDAPFRWRVDQSRRLR